MMPEERTSLIRQANQLFNEGNFREAAKIYIQTKYKDGLIRMGDFYYFEKNDLVSALKFYNYANYKKAMHTIIEKIVPVIRQWLNQDGPETPKPIPNPQTTKTQSRPKPPEANQQQAKPSQQSAGFEPKSITEIAQTNTSKDLPSKDKND
jgi:hypothetical protein